MPVLANPRYEKFAQLLVGGMAAVDAHEAAGFRRNDSNAIRLKNRAEVAARVAELQQETANASELSREDLLRELEHIIKADQRLFYRPDGSLRPVHELDERLAAALAGMEVIGIADSKGGTDGKGLVITRKIKRFDKIRAIELYARITGRLKDVPGGGGGMTLEQLVLASMTIKGDVHLHVGGGASAPVAALAAPVLEAAVVAHTAASPPRSPAGPPAKPVIQVRK